MNCPTCAMPLTNCICPSVFEDVEQRVSRLVRCDSDDMMAWNAAMATVEDRIDQLRQAPRPQAPDPCQHCTRCGATRAPGHLTGFTGTFGDSSMVHRLCEGCCDELTKAIGPRIEEG